MSTLLNPAHGVAYDAATDRIVIALRDGRDSVVVELDPEGTPALINALMAARNAAKLARKAVALPPPMTRPMTCPRPKPPAVPGPDVAPPDRLPVRWIGGPRR